MRLAILNGNIVENVVIADLAFAESMNWNYVELEDDIVCESGWIYDKKKFKKPVVDETLAE